MGDGGAGAGCTDDEDRPLDPLLADLGMLADMLGQQQPLTQQVGQVRAGQHPAESVEAVLVFERGDQAIETRLETRVAEFGQAARAAAGAVHQH